MGHDAELLAVAGAAGYSNNYQRTSLALEWLDGSLLDTSANSNDGTNLGATLVNNQFGKANKGWSFDGINDIQYAADHASLDITDAITVGGYFYIDPLAANMDGQTKVIATKGDLRSASGGWKLDWDDRGVGFKTNGINFQILTSIGVFGITGASNLIPSAGYYGIFGRYDKDAGANNLEVVINKVPAAQATYANVIGTNNLPVMIGDSSNATIRRFAQMKYDRVFIYSAAVANGNLP